MAQIHYVVYYDTVSNSWHIDDSSTEARFPEGTTYIPDAWDWVDTFEHQSLVEIDEIAHAKLEKLLKGE